MTYRNGVRSRGRSAVGFPLHLATLGSSWHLGETHDSGHLLEDLYGSSFGHSKDKDLIDFIVLIVGLAVEAILAHETLTSISRHTRYSHMVWLVQPPAMQLLE